MTIKKSMDLDLDARLERIEETGAFTIITKVARQYQTQGRVEDAAQMAQLAEDIAVDWLVVIYNHALREHSYQNL